MSGIEVSAKLDPNNVTAFITGLTFVADGKFTGTMTPVVTEIAATPEPATILLLGASLVGSGLAARRRRRGLGSPRSRAARRPAFRPIRRR